jgi:hypothetical protein
MWLMAKGYLRSYAKSIVQKRAEAIRIEQLTEPTALADLPGTVRFQIAMSQFALLFRSWEYQGKLRD